jgi:hypothetical protein
MQTATCVAGARKLPALAGYAAAASPGGSNSGLERQIGANRLPFKALRVKASVNR